MKSKVSLTIACVMMLVLTACGGNTESTVGDTLDKVQENYTTVENSASNIKPDTDTETTKVDNAEVTEHGEIQESTSITEDIPLGENEDTIDDIADELGSLEVDPITANGSAENPGNPTTGMGKPISESTNQENNETTTEIIKTSIIGAIEHYPEYRNSTIEIDGWLYDKVSSNEEFYLIANANGAGNAIKCISNEKSTTEVIKVCSDGSAVTVTGKLDVDGTDELVIVLESITVTDGSGSNESGGNAGDYGESNEDDGAADREGSDTESESVGQGNAGGWTPDNSDINQVDFNTIIDNYSNYTESTVMIQVYVKEIIEGGSALMVYDGTNSDTTLYCWSPNSENWDKWVNYKSGDMITLIGSTCPSGMFETMAFCVDTVR